MNRYLPLFLALVIGIAVPALSEELRKSPTPEGASVYIISPTDGSVVPTTFRVQFGLSGMGVAPAGVEMENTGHFHLLIDVDELPDLNLPLPKNEKVMHFGGGQTETELSLEPGVHSLQLIMGDYAHTPHQPPVISKKINIFVEQSETVE